MQIFLLIVVVVVAVVVIIVIIIFGPSAQYAGNKIDIIDINIITVLLLSSSLSSSSLCTRSAFVATVTTKDTFYSQSVDINTPRAWTGSLT